MIFSPGHLRFIPSLCTLARNRGLDAWPGLTLGGFDDASRPDDTRRRHRKKRRTGQDGLSRAGLSRRCGHRVLAGLEDVVEDAHRPPAGVRDDEVTADFASTVPTTPMTLSVGHVRCGPCYRRGQDGYRHRSEREVDASEVVGRPAQRHSRPYEGHEECDRGEDGITAHGDEA